MGNEKNRFIISSQNSMYSMRAGIFFFNNFHNSKSKEKPVFTGNMPTHAIINIPTN